MTARSFLKIVFATALSLFLLNGAGAAAFFWSLRSGQVKKTSADGTEGWELQSENNKARRPLNDIGLREGLSKAEMAQDPRPKIVLLGNSMVYGGGVHDKPIFADILRTQLQAQYQLINAGIEAVEIWREFSFFEKHLLEMKPRLVIWFPSSNDFIPRAYVQEKQAESQKQNQAAEGFQKSLLLKPFFFQTLAQKIYFEHSVIAGNFMSSSHNQYYTQGILQKPSIEIVQELNLEIRRFQKSLAAVGSRLIIVFIPSKMYSKLYTWNEAMAFQYLAAIAQDIQIPVYQALDVMNQSCGPECYLDYVHLNEKGHAFIGQELTEILKTELQR